MEDERKVNEALNSGICPDIESSTTKTAGLDNYNKDKKGVDFGSTSSGRLQTSLKVKLKDQKKNSFGMGGSIKANLENNRKHLSRLVRPGEGRVGDSPIFLTSLPSPRIGSLALPLVNHSPPLYHLEFH
jgi:hypothetical protein